MFKSSSPYTHLNMPNNSSCAIKPDPLREWVSSITLPCPSPPPAEPETSTAPVISPCHPHTVTFQPADRSSSVCSIQLGYDCIVTLSTTRWSVSTKYSNSRLLSTKVAQKTPKNFTHLLMSYESRSGTNNVPLSVESRVP